MKTTVHADKICEDIFPEKTPKTSQQFQETKNKTQSQDQPQFKMLIFGLCFILYSLKNLPQLS